MTYKSNRSGLDGANKSGNSSNAQCLKVLISNPRSSSNYPEIKIIEEKRKTERMQGEKINRILEIFFSTVCFNNVS